MSAELLEVTDDNFEELILNNPLPVLVDFWAPWCGPCKAIGPIIHELADEFGDQMVFAKCEVDQNPLTPGRYGIRAIPTLLIFKSGEPVEIITGMTGKTALETKIKNALGGQASKRPFVVH